MKKIYIPLTVFFLLIINGCGLLTLHPIFTPNDLVYDTKLIGEWKAEGSRIQIEAATSVDPNEIPVSLHPHKKRFYLFKRINSDGEIEDRALAFLVKIGSQSFLDLYPLETDKSTLVDGFFKSNQYKLHQITRIRLASGKLYWQDFQDNYVEELIAKKQVRIKHTPLYEMYNEEDKDGILITAGTKDLQAFLLKYGTKDEAFKSIDKSNTYNKISGL